MVSQTDSSGIDGIAFGRIDKSEVTVGKCAIEQVDSHQFQSTTGIPDLLCKIATLPLKGAGKGVGIEGSLAARHFRLGDFALG